MAEELKPNSHAYKEQQKKEHKTEKVVQGEVTTRKKSLVKRAEGAMLSEDASTVKEYLFWDVLIPAVKELVAESVKKAVDAIFYGDRRTSSSLERNKGTTYVRYDKASYDRPYRSSSSRSARVEPRTSYNRRAAHDFDDIILESRTDAENVLDALVDSTMNYGLVSVADFYEMVGLDPKYTDWKWGWYELSKARVERVRSGYIVVLPHPVVLDDEAPF